MSKTSGAATADTKVKTGRIAEVLKPQTKLNFSTREFRSPGPAEVRIKIEACGVCHSDSFPFAGVFPGQKYPIAPGHEIVGTIDQVGSDAGRFKVGDRVGVGWHAGHCHECLSCRSGDFITCQKLQIPGINTDGGYAEYAVFPEEVCAVVPENLNSAEAAPLLCAGVTTYNALRNAGAKPGDTVAILGMGGLGHLGIQFANKMGFHTVAIARGDEKAKFAAQLGAHEYINSENPKAVQTLQNMGGAQVILSTITNSAAMTPWVDGLCVNGRLVLVGADFEPIQVSPVTLLAGRKSVTGWPSGCAKDSEDCLRFAALTGVRPLIEKFPLEKAQEAVDRMMSGKARFRVVLEVSAG